MVRRTALICSLTSIIGCSSNLVRCFRGQAPPAFSPGHLGRQRVQTRAPAAPESPEPGRPLPRGRVVPRVGAAGPVRAYRRETVVPQHLEMLADGRLGDAELGPDD